MALFLTTRCTGLHSQPNDIGEIPDGALKVLDNCQVSRDGIIEPRRGFTAAATRAATRIFPHDDILIVASSGLLYYSNADGSVWTSVPGSIGNTNTAVPIRFLSARKNLYKTSDYGIERYASVTSGSAYYAGVPGGRDLQISAYGGSGFLTAYSSVAYRVAWKFTDANGNVTIGAPSGRVVYENNTGSSLDTIVSTTIPGDIPAGAICQFYRTQIQEGTSTFIADPGDEAGLVYERVVPAAVTVTQYSRTAAVVTVTTSGAHGFQRGDVIRVQGTTSFAAGDFLITGTPLTTTFEYTQAGSATTSGALSQAAALVGIGFQDTTPDTFLGAALYTNQSQEGILQANTRPPMSRDMAMFRNSAWYAYATENESVTVTLMATGSPTGLQNSDTVTIRGVTYTGSTTAEDTYNRVFYVSTGTTVANDVALTAQSLVRVVNRYDGADLQAEYLSSENDAPGKMRFTTVRRAGSTLSFTSSRKTAFPSDTLPKSSSAQTFKNRIYYSKTDQPEAVPLLNFFDIGGSDQEAMRVVPLRDAMMVIKPDGIYRITGNGPFDFRVDPFDLTVNCIGVEIPAALENTVFALSTQGVIRISDTGVTVISRPIEDQLLPLIVGTALTATETYAFGAAYESGRKFLLWMPTAGGVTTCGQAFVYDLFTETWVRWTKAALDAVVNPYDDKLYVVNGTSVLRERKDFADSDFQDESGAAISCSMTWAPKFGDRPDVGHQFREVGLLFRRAGFTSATLQFTTDLDQSTDTVTLAGATYGLTSPANQPIIRSLVPKAKQRGSQLNVTFNHANAALPFQLQGLRVVYETGSERIRR